MTLTKEAININRILQMVFDLPALYMQYSIAGKLPTYISIVVSCIYKAIPHLVLYTRSFLELEHFCIGHRIEYTSY